MIPDGRSKHSIMSDIAQQNYFQIHKGLVSPIEEGEDPRAKNFYQSCLDLEMLQKVSYQPLLNLFEKQLKLPTSIIFKRSTLIDPQTVLE